MGILAVPVKFQTPYSDFVFYPDVKNNEKKLTEREKTANAKQTENIEKNKRKLQKFAIMGAEAALVFAAYIALRPKNNNSAVASVVKGAKEHAQEVINSSKQIFDEVVQIFNDDSSSIPASALSKFTLAQDGSLCRRLMRINSKNIMDEFSKNGDLYRRTVFEGNEVRVYNANIGDTNDIEQWGEILTFINGKLSVFEQGYEKLSDNLQKWKKILIFDEEKIKTYAINALLHDSLYDYKTCILFKNAEPYTFLQGVESLKDGTIQCAKKYITSGEKWVLA